MKKIIELLLLCIFLPSAVSAQFQKYFSNITEYQQLASSPVDNSYVIAASAGSNDGLDFSAVKINTSGEVSWSKTYSSAGDDYLSSIAVAPSGEIFLGGYKLNKDGHFDFSLMKLNASGTMQWYKTYETAVSDICVYVGVTPSGDVFLTGNIDSDTKKHIWILKLDGSGDVRWSKIYGSASGGNKNMNILASVITKEGGLAVVGVDGTQTYFLKLAADGEESITKMHNAISYFEEASSLKQLNDGGFIFCGKIKDCNSELCTYIFAFMKLDQNGDVAWSKNVARSVSTGVKYIGKAKDAVETSDGGFAFIGQLTDDDANQSSKLVVIKTNATGTILWTKGYGKADSYGEYAGVEPTADGGLLLLGTENSNALLIKTNGDGVVNCNSQQLDPVFSDESAPKSIAVKFPELKDVTSSAVSSCTESVLPVKSSVACGEILSIHNPLNKSVFQIYPNPFKEVLVIETFNQNKFTDNVEFNIYNLLGEKIATQSLPPNEQRIVVSTAEFTKGIYFYEIQNKGVSIDKGKLIAQ